MADDLQRRYIAIAPICFPGSSNGGKTGDYPSVDAAREAVPNSMPPS